MRPWWDIPAGYVAVIMAALGAAVLVTSCTTNVYNEKTLEGLARSALALKPEGSAACTDISAPPDLVGRYCLYYAGPIPQPSSSGSPSP